MLVSSLHLRRLLLSKPCTRKVLVANYRMSHRYEAPQKERKSLWREDFVDVKRERVIQLKALNMTCAEQIAMLKRSVEKGVIVGPRHMIQFLEKASNVSIDSLLEVVEIANTLQCKDVDLRHTLKPDQADRAWQLLRESGLPLSEILYSYALALFRFAKVSTRVYELAAEGLSRGFMTGNNMPATVYFLTVNDKYEQAIDLIIKARQQGINMENPTYDVVKAAALADVSNAFQLLHKLIDAGIKPDAPILSAVVYQFFTTTQDEEGTINLEKIVTMLKTLNYTVDHLLWDIIDSYTQKNTPERIAPFLRDWFTKLQYSVPSCEKIEYHMRPYVRSKKETWKVESNVVVEVVNALTKNHSIVPDSRIYLLLLAAYDRLNNLPAIVGLLMEMESKDCPDPRAHTIALEAAAKSKNLEAGQMLFQLAKSSHIRLRPSLYTAALKVAVQCETLDWARSLFAELIQLKPSAHLSQLPYDLMISALMSRDHLDEALGLLNEMEVSGTPTTESYFKILVRLIELGNNSLANTKMQGALNRNIVFSQAQRAALEAAYDSRPTPPQTTTAATNGEPEDLTESSPNFDNYYMENYPYSDSDQYLDGYHADDQSDNLNNPSFSESASTHNPSNSQQSNDVDYSTHNNAVNGNMNIRDMEYDPNVIIDVPEPSSPTYYREGNQIARNPYPYPRAHLLHEQYPVPEEDYQPQQHYSQPPQAYSTSPQAYSPPPQAYSPPPQSFQPPPQVFQPPPYQAFSSPPPVYEFPPPQIYIPQPQSNLYTPSFQTPPHPFHTPPPPPPPMQTYPPAPTLPLPPPLPLPPMHQQTYPDMYQTGNYPPNYNQNYPQNFPPQNFPPPNYSQNFPPQNSQSNYPYNSYPPNGPFIPYGR